MLGSYKPSLIRVYMEWEWQMYPPRASRVSMSCDIIIIFPINMRCQIPCYPFVSWWLWIFVVTWSIAWSFIVNWYSANKYGIQKHSATLVISRQMARHIVEYHYNAIGEGWHWISDDTNCAASRLTLCWCSAVTPR